MNAKLLNTAGTFMLSTCTTKDPVRLRIVDDAAPAPDASIVEPSLEDLFLYHFSEDAQDGRSDDDENLN